MVRISACVITKNEEENLPRWLECVRHIADEFIVVDTGSTDNTVSLAKRGGAKVYHYTWHNDFASAKNYAIKQAVGDWIIFMDADEYFREGDYTAVRNLIRKYHKDPWAMGVFCQLVNIDTDHNNRVISIIYQLRIFRRKPFICFEGKIHEYLRNFGDSRNKLLYDDKIVIVHTGYSYHIIKKKLKRNLEILLKEKKEKADDAELQSYLADCYYGLEEYDKALEYAMWAMEGGIKRLGMEGKLELIAIQSMIKLNRSHDEQINFLKSCQERNPNEGAYYLLQGILHARWHEYLAAEKHLSKGFQLLAAKEKENSIEKANQFLQVNAQACMQYGIICRRRNRVDEALDYFVKGLGYDRYEPGLLVQLLSTMRTLSKTDVMQLLQRYYNLPFDDEFIQNAARQAGLTEWTKREDIYEDVYKVEAKLKELYGLRSWLLSRMNMSDDLYRKQLPTQWLQAYERIKNGKTISKRTDYSQEKENIIYAYLMDLA
ncbi:glycosyltransferase family 2 protein [Selenomonas sp. FC4001]|uniref:glycosyltransferase family 2 protein n=1 Tax=Selenomonas sp. FC4001 TaxID=1408313 RepID=UPI00069029BF|nr:glycosyltransferase family 2 protein [Selenomonas sp. FC4001]